ncbi:MAG: sialate O-acetylesterase [Lentisphaeraceae bacterium]|nr:sialate O-acetylesterase [Lentisphaeraceae bacterium]
MNSAVNNIPFLKSMSRVLLGFFLISIVPLQAKEKELVDIVFVGGQSNAVSAWANGIKKELQSSKAFSNLVIVHKYHPGHWLQSWYSEKTNKDFDEDFYNKDGSGALEKAWKNAIANGKTPRLAGFFWFQGEGDTGDPNIDKNYERRFNKILSLLQSHFKQTAPIPFAVAIIDANQDPRYNDPKVLVGRTRAKVEKMRDIHKKLGKQTNGVAVDTREFSRSDAWHLKGGASVSGF